MSQFLFPQLERGLQVYKPIGLSLSLGHSAPPGLPLDHGYEDSRSQGVRVSDRHQVPNQLPERHGTKWTLTQHALRLFPTLAV